MSASCDRTMCGINAGTLRPGEARERKNGADDHHHVVACDDPYVAAIYSSLHPGGIQSEVWRQMSRESRDAIVAEITRVADTLRPRPTATQASGLGRRPSAVQTPAFAG